MSMGISSPIAGASQDVVSAIKNASRQTGVDFDYLVNQARTESSFRPDVKAATSSATGLYQFIDQTWLQMVSQHGSKYGLNDEAAQITKDFQGRFFVSDDTQKQRILDLRKDPDIASLMAAEFALSNKKIVEGKTGIEAKSTDLYMAHFLGPGGASNFIKAMQDAPYRPAAYLMPAAANANKNIFYNSDGSPKSFEQIYKNFEDKFGDVTTVQRTQNDTPLASDRTYTRDVSFERMYGNEIATFVRDMPNINGFQSGSFFEGLFGSDIAKMMQHSTHQNSLLLTLTMLDSPK